VQEDAAGIHLEINEKNKKMKEETESRKCKKFYRGEDDCL
jgi:hypothetical protein